jgi:fatty-acid desaturase
MYGSTRNTLRQDVGGWPASLRGRHVVTSDHRLDPSRWTSQYSDHLRERNCMITLGLLLLLIGFLTGIAVLWTLGVIILVIGLALWILGSLGHAVGGRRHYF